MLTDERANAPEHCQPLHNEYDEYCPVHEFDWPDCCNCCIERRSELHRIDIALRRYWWFEGFSFRDRGRTDR